MNKTQKSISIKMQDNIYDNETIMNVNECTYKIINSNKFDFKYKEKLLKLINNSIDNLNYIQILYVVRYFIGKLWDWILLSLIVVILTNWLNPNILPDILKCIHNSNDSLKEEIDKLNEKVDKNSCDISEIYTEIQVAIIPKIDNSEKNILKELSERNSVCLGECENIRAEIDTVRDLIKTRKFKKYNKRH